MLEHIRKNNVERFAGFGELYDRNRPAAPEEVMRIVETYLEGTPRTVVDVGCGTGLSTFLWLGRAEEIIGIEPSSDMRAIAEQKREAAGRPDKLSFRAGFSDNLELQDGFADLITCSQSFHWMNPQPSLAEFARVLRSGGMFAAYDCDWPPVLNAEIEGAYTEFSALADRRSEELAVEEELAYKWPKEEHLRQITESGLFRYTREVVFHNREICNAERYTNIALSQGGMQSAIKRGAEDVKTAGEDFRQRVESFFAGEQKEILFSYRMRLGVK